MSAVPVSASRKRKRDEEKVLLGEPFVIQPHSSSIYESALNITPAVIFPRILVPLNWLSGVPSRLFSANIPALDLPGNILIIKTDGERQLSAVERIADGMFTLCKLSAHVKMKEVRRMAQLAKKALPASSDCADIGKESFQKQWWESLAIDTFAVGVVDPKGESVILSMMHHSKVKQRPEAISEATQAKDPKLPSPPAEPAEFVEPTPAEVLEQTRTQYMETLYIAKSSIAYFAKSTLSRARVTFQGDSSGSQSSTWDQLLDFLKGMLLPLDKMDIKYRKVITQIATEDDIENTGILKEGEEEYVQRWVSMNFKDKVLQINDEGLKRQIEDLKIRETEIQIILLLEILAIMQQNKPSQADFPAPVEDEKSQKKKKSKKTSSLKKKYKTKPLKDSTPDPKILLELLLDRLCIWRSITSASAALEPSRQTAHQTKNGEDRLRHFCIEVVMQFYSSRLPETCAMIQKKFGANAVPSGTPRKPQPPRKKVLVPKPSLSRANTAPVTAAGSRAASVTLEASRAAPRKSVDLGAVAKRALQKREIQMPALNAARKINIEEELKDAIKGLAKPNRMAAGAEAMDAVTKRLGGSIRKTKKPVRNPNANTILVMATPKKKNRIRRLPEKLAIHEEPDEDHQDDDDSHLPSPHLPPNTQTAIFASPRNYKYGPPPIFASRLLQVQKVPESSPAPDRIPDTPLKLGNGAQAAWQLLMTPGYEGLMSDDNIPESSPISKRPSIARAKSCLFPASSASRGGAGLSVIAETPTKKRRTTFSNPFQEDSETEQDESQERVRGGDGDGVIAETPVKIRRTTADFTMPSVNTSSMAASRLGFEAAVSAVAETPMKLRRRNTEGSVPVSGDNKPAEMEEEVSIYQKLGWEDDYLF